jgi:hypothetical protein
LINWNEINFGIDPDHIEVWLGSNPKLPQILADPFDDERPSSFATKTG